MGAPQYGVTVEATEGDRHLVVQPAVEGRFHDQVEKDEGFGPVVGNEGPLHHFSQWLEARRPFSAGTVLSGIRPRPMSQQLRRAVRQALPAAQLVARLEGGVQRSPRRPTTSCSYSLPATAPSWVGGPRKARGS